MRLSIRTVPAMLCTLSMGLGARAQDITLTTSWVEVLAGTNTPVPLPDGILSPGEAARIEITATLTPGVGTPVTYNAPPAPGFGRLAGLGFIYFAVIGTNNAAGDWSNPARAPGWALGSWGYLAQSGGVVEDCSAGQFIQNGSIANSTNPVPAIWSGVWTPASYSKRTASWRTGDTLHSQGGFLIQYGEDPNSGLPLYVGRIIPQTYGAPVGIPIVPAPSAAAAIIAAAAFVAARRRRPPITHF